MLPKISKDSFGCDERVWVILNLDHSSHSWAFLAYYSFGCCSECEECATKWLPPSISVPPKLLKSFLKNKAWRSAEIKDIVWITSEVFVLCAWLHRFFGGAPLYSSTSALSRTGSLNLGVKSFESTQRPSVQQQLQVWEMGNYCPFKIHSLRCLIFNLSSHHRGGRLYCNRLFSGYLTKYQSSTDTGINGHLPDSWETGERLLKLLELLENDTRDHMGFSVLLRW